jgi:uncharacterized protein
MRISDQNNRIYSIDALRGFALAGIVLVHFVEQFIGGSVPEEQSAKMLQGIPDYIVAGILQLFFSGKFFALFSILFGLSFYIQMDNSAKKGKDYRLRFIWRLLILGAIGLVHSLFYSGDILTIYVAIGLFLPLFYHVSNRWILAIAGVLFLGLGRFVIFSIMGSETFFGLMDFNPNSKYALETYNILKFGTIQDVFKNNMTNGLLMKIEFQFGTFNRGYLTMGYFLVGMWIGRIRLFERLDELKSVIKNVMWYSLGFSLVCIVVMAIHFSQIPQPIDFNKLTAMIALNTMDLANIGLTTFILTAFLTVYRGKKGDRLNALAPYGRTALTNYFFQSIIGTTLFYGYGFGLLTELRNIYTFLIALLVLFVQIMISKWWMARFYYGPFEWIWRCLTWWTWMPLVRK